eukprot:Selendium_serpulae@DN6346_c0_g1_i6.p1
MDKEIAEMRARALAESKASGREQEERKAQMEEQKKDMEERRRAMLRTICEPSALERLNRVSMVKPEKARAVENHLLQSAQSGRLVEKIDEHRVKAILEQLSAEQPSRGPSVTINRRHFDSDDDDDI